VSERRAETETPAEIAANGGRRAAGGGAASGGLAAETEGGGGRVAAEPAGASGRASGGVAAEAEGGPRSLDGVSGFMGLRWDDPQTVRLRIRAELINGGGLLSGVATFAMVDYCMGSTLWAQTTPEEHIATINIAINYVQSATEGEIVCRTTLDRRNRTSAVMRSEVRHEDGRLLVTAVGSYAIFPARGRGHAMSAMPAAARPQAQPPSTPAQP